MKRQTLKVIEREIAVCGKCNILCMTRKRTVPGEGHYHARLFIVGEAPGVDEDKEGRPFVGAAGKLLNGILAACQWERDQVFIANILKCRPPSNRVPDPVEISNCVGYLRRQIEAVKPEFILCLGSVASNTLIGVPVGEARGKWFSYKDIPTLCTYHPSYVLRKGESAKKELWKDLQPLIEALKGSLLQA